MFIDRGDCPVDFSLEHFTLDLTWRELSLASIIPDTAKAVLLRVRVRGYLPYIGEQYSFQVKSSYTIVDQNIAIIQPAVDGITTAQDIVIPVGSDRKIKYRGNAVTALYLTVAGWWGWNPPDNAKIFTGDSIVALWNNPCLGSVNHGVSGSKIEHQKNYLYPYPYFEPLFLVCEVGTNNLGVGDSVADALGKYSQFLDFAKTRFNSVYCISVLPIHKSKFLATFGAVKQYINMPWSKVVEFNAGLQQLCIQKGCVFIDASSRFYCESIDGMNPAYTNDGIHPNTTGYQVLKDLLIANIPNI